MNDITCTADWLRSVINGQTKFRKCPQCDNEGIEIQSYDENGQPCAADDKTAERYGCVNCGEVAYLEIP